MNKKIAFSMLIISILWGILFAAAYIFDFVQGVRDYKKTLATVQANSSEVEDNSKQNLQKSIKELIGEKGSSISEGNIINILFLGIDRTEERDKTLGVYRTDTIVLASVDMDSMRIRALSIPRDTRTYLQCVGKDDKINHAYAFGGMKEKGINNTIEAVNKLIKYSRVDFYFSMDMQPIPDIVDDIGGVEMDVEIDMKDHGANLSKGRQILDGKNAFDYVHWRYSANGDIDRIKRQQKFVKAVYTSVKEKKRLVESMKLVLNYNKFIQTNMSAKQLFSCAALMNDIPQENINFQTVPGKADYINGISYWVVDDKKSDALLREMFK